MLICNHVKSDCYVGLISMYLSLHVLEFGNVEVRHSCGPTQSTKIL